MTMKDLMPSDNGNGARSEIVATYDYRNAAGDLQYQVVRFEPKDFRQRRPDANGGWVWKLDGVKRVLYRLPELLAADRMVNVFVSEGERDVDRLISVGLVATCNAGGAGKWRAEYGHVLTDRRVVVLPDNDDPGRAYARTVAGNLCGVAESVKVLELPGFPPKGDVCDWFADGGTADELVRLAGEAPEWELTPAPAVVSGSDYH